MAEGGKEDRPPSNKKPFESQEDSDSGTLEKLRQYFVEKLGFSAGAGTEAEEEEEKILDDVSLEGIANYIKEKKCKNIVVMAGAGISTSAGIPDFRSPGSGLYDNLQKYNLPDPQAIFEIGFFKENPQPFFALARELFPDSFKPTPCHYLVRLLNEKGMLLRHYTQNIDTLERVAGIPPEKIVEAHGTFHTSHCLDMFCHKEYSLNWMKEKIFNDVTPTCESCNSLVKPDIVFFGESLPSRFFQCMQSDFSKCDALIVMGTSLVVQPFASLVDRTPRKCPRLLINREKAGERDELACFLGLGYGLNFDSAKNSRDVAWLGDCDDGCYALADALGFGDELRELVAKEHAELDKKMSKKKTEEKKPEKDDDKAKKEASAL